MVTAGLALLFAIVAALYASVGLAGATGYLAVMALCGVDAGAMKSTSLLLNGIVAAVGSAVFGRTGGRPPGLLRPITVAAVPMALLGGAVRLPAGVYLPVVGLLMIASAFRLLRATGDGAGPMAPHEAPARAVVALGASVGFVSGLTGTGGGIFLLPSLQLLGWAGPREAAAIASPFVMVTSIAGLVGHLSVGVALPHGLALWVPSVLIGGLIGARAGRDRLGPRAMRRVLAALLVAAGLKLLVP